MTRISSIGGPDMMGDITAPPGSHLWAVAVRNEIQESLDSHRKDYESLVAFVDLFTRYDGWRKLTDAKGRQFRSYADFCKASKPFGLGRDHAEVDALVKEGTARKTAEERAKSPPTLLDHGGDRVSEKVEQGNDVTLIRGNHADYLTARIARDRPDILERMQAGEFSSVRAAAIEAGIVKVPTTLERVMKLLPKLNDDELRQVHEAAECYQQKRR